MSKRIQIGLPGCLGHIWGGGYASYIYIYNFIETNNKYTVIYHSKPIWGSQKLNPKKVFFSMECHKVFRGLP